MSNLDKYPQNILDPRSRATYAIWGFATGMFVLCIPLVAISRNAVLIPTMVALGAGVGTTAVWRSDRFSRQRLEAEKVRLLEERIANLEAIASHNGLELQHQFKQLELKDHQTE